jgi:hypothetical protein
MNHVRGSDNPAACIRWGAAWQPRGVSAELVRARLLLLGSCRLSRGCGPESRRLRPRATGYGRAWCAGRPRDGGPAALMKHPPARLGHGTWRCAEDPNAGALAKTKDRPPQREERRAISATHVRVRHHRPARPAGRSGARGAGPDGRGRSNPGIAERPFVTERGIEKARHEHLPEARSSSRALDHRRDLVSQNRITACSTCPSIASSSTGRQFRPPPRRRGWSSGEDPAHALEQRLPTSPRDPHHARRRLVAILTDSLLSPKACHGLPLATLTDFPGPPPTQWLDITPPSGRDFAPARATASKTEAAEG